MGACCVTAGEDMTPAVRRVRNFLTRMEKELRKHPLWRADTHDPDKWQTIVDAMGRWKSAPLLPPAAACVCVLTRSGVVSGRDVCHL